MDTWLKSTGWIQIDDGIRIITNYDICRYYQWFVKKEFWNTVKTQLPKHGAHVTIVNPKIYKVKNFDAVKKFKNKKVEFEYCPSQLYISRVNFWIPVKCRMAKVIRDSLGIDMSKYGCDKGLHMTICNKKFNGDTQGHLR